MLLACATYIPAPALLPCRRYVQWRRRMAQAHGAGTLRHELESGAALSTEMQACALPSWPLQATTMSLSGKESMQHGVKECRYRTAPLTPFCDLLPRKKGGGGHNNEDLRFCLTVKPPPSHEFAY